MKSKTLKPLKRSTSPFSPLPPEDDPLQTLKESFEDVFKTSGDPSLKKLTKWDDAAQVPSWVEKFWFAPANDAADLNSFCEFLVKYKTEFNENGLSAQLFQSMTDLFFTKTELFLIDHHDKESCEKQELDLDYKDIVLFQKERNALIGLFFEPYSEKEDELFSSFIEKWRASDHLDRLLHFADFCAGSKSPTFEHLVVSSRPPLSKMIEDKEALKGLFEECQPLLKKLKSPTWETDTRAALGISLPVEEPEGK